MGLNIKQFIIENDKIGLRKTLAEEVELICVIEKDSDNKEYIIPYDQQRHLQVIDSKDEAHLSIWLKETNQLIGFIILAGLENPSLSLEFRRIVVQAKGKGYGRQSLQLVKKYCFEVLKFHRLWLDVFENNSRAIHIYKSEGFAEEGKLRDVIKQGDDFRSLVLMSILDHEYFS